MADLLLVDNDARIVELTAWFLERRGHRVRTANSYAQVRDSIAEGGAPDLLLADLELGAERGVEELPRLAAHGLLPPTLVVSGYLDAALERELTALAGIVGTLAKPFDMPELEAAIERCLARAAGARDARPSMPQPRRDPIEAARDDLEDDDEGWVEILPTPRAARAEPPPAGNGNPTGGSSRSPVEGRSTFDGIPSRIPGPGA